MNPTIIIYEHRLSLVRVMSESNAQERSKASVIQELDEIAAKDIKGL